MPTISQLSAVTSLSTGDNIVIQSAANNDARKASLSVLLSFFEEQFASPEFETVITAPTVSGFNLQLAASTKNIWAIINPTGAFAAATITLPPVASCFDGQQIVVTCSAAITALTLTGNGATIVGAPTTLGTGGFFALRFNDLQNAWYCVSQSLGATTTFSNITITNAILDANGNEILAVTPTSPSAVNHVMAFNAATGAPPGFTAEGTDTNIGLLFEAKGNGVINLVTPSGVAQVNGDEVITQLAAQVIQNKTYDTPSCLNHVLIQALLIAGLEPPSAGIRGARATVTNSNATLAAGIGAIVAAGGANVVPVFCDGTNWRIG